MIYGYLRVSTDKQEVESQKQGVENFAKAKGWNIDKYISDEGVSGGKDPSKRKLGKLLEALKSEDIVVAAEISRLGRDLYMVMDILHHCMKVGCTIYTVKEGYKLSDDVQSKVLSFAFGLAAEIERQMIRQRTAEGLKLRRKMGVLLGRPTSENFGTNISDEAYEKAKYQYELGVPLRRIAKNLGVDRNSIDRAFLLRDVYGHSPRLDKLKAKLLREKEAKRANLETLYNGNYETPISEEQRSRIKQLIEADLTLPLIAESIGTISYEQLYDFVALDKELNPLYREHGQKKAKKIKS